ncbi:MAG: hypothetical protein ACHP7P_10650 [Terriglobales bacterium]
MEISGYDGSAFTANCLGSLNVATNRPSLMLNDNPWFGHWRIAGGWWIDFAATGPAVQVSPGQTADMSFGGAVDAACWYDSPEGAPSFDDWYSYTFQNEVGSPCFIDVNCPYPLPQLEYPGVDTETITVFSELVPQVFWPYQVEPIYTASQGTVAAGDCPDSPYPGFVRYVTNQVQYADGTALAVAGLTVADTLSPGGRADLGSGTSTGSATTTGDGSFDDRYSVCSAACTASTGETDALQYWTVNGVPLFHVDGNVYKCNSITIDGR